MSYQAVQWAMYHAPTLLTTAGKPDATAAAVLIARAERASPDGRDSYAGHAEIARITRLDEATVKRAEKRLEAAGILIRDGRSHLGTVRWHLDMTLRQETANQAIVDDQLARRRKADAARQQRARERKKAGSSPVDIEDDVAIAASVTDSASVSHGSSVRDVTDSASGRHGRSALQTTLLTTHLNHPEPPTGGSPAPRPPRPPSPPAPGNESEKVTQRDPTPSPRPSAQPPTARATAIAAMRALGRRPQTA